MKPTVPLILAFFGSTAIAVAQLRPDGATASFKGSLPPKATADISAEQQSALEKELADVTKAFQSVKKHARSADADIFLKAVRYAIEFHEWYDKKPEDGVKKARALLAEATLRIEALRKNQTPWMNGPGQKVLGFYSSIDDSPQPYGVEVPEGLKWGPGQKPVPMWIWLHGRGDTSTDIHFIASQMKSKGGQFKPAGTIVVHPFGRYCNGWKSAGETDVFECKADATQRFNVDVNRIALAGFSMGGAGAWHLGAHFADQWACVHTGAGFVDVKRYQKITPDKMPPWYEEKLWGVYDVPDYARNFFNVPLVSYSGEIDTQRDSAEYMMEVLAKEGLHPPHLIGPGMPHKYHPETIKEVQKLIEEAVAKGRNPTPKKVTLQTRSLDYSSMFWIKLVSQEQPWEDTRIEAELGDDGVVRVKTRNAAGFDVRLPAKPKAIEIDGQRLSGDVSCCRKTADGKWTLPEPTLTTKTEFPGLKRAGQCGPIEQPLKHRFLVVLPEGDSANPAVTQWMRQESSHFVQRWRGLMRGDALVKPAAKVTPEDMQRCTLVLWGDARSNPLVAKVLAATSVERLPLAWSGSKLTLGAQTFDGATHVPLMVRPNPLEPRGSIILNSGLTFREAHDKTNSLQNPKLPDWAILDITQAPNAESAGRVVAADFFDEHWQLRPPAAKR
jgi:hypothetical protein